MVCRPAGIRIGALTLGAWMPDVYSKQPWLDWKRRTCAVRPIIVLRNPSPQTPSFSPSVCVNCRRAVRSSAVCLVCSVIMINDTCVRRFGVAEGYTVRTCNSITTTLKHRSHARTCSTYLLPDCHATASLASCLIYAWALPARPYNM